MWWDSKKNSILICLFLFGVGCQKNHDVAKIYLASSLISITEEIEQFLKGYMTVDLVFMSSNALARQIEEGSPCDVAIVVDDEWHRYLLKKNAVLSHVQILAKNSLSIVSHAPIRGSIHDLLQGIKPPQKIIIADPDFVPLGYYTKEALVNLQLFDKLMSQFLRAHSARQAVLLFEQKIAPVAIIYHSDAIHFSNNISIHPSLYRPIHYPFLVCKKADPRRVQVLKKLFFSDAFMKILVQNGFD